MINCVWCFSHYSLSDLSTIFTDSLIIVASGEVRALAKGLVFQKFLISAVVTRLKYLSKDPSAFVRHDATSRSQFIWESDKSKMLVAKKNDI